MCPIPTRCFKSKKSSEGYLVSQLSAAGEFGEYLHLLLLSGLSFFMQFLAVSNVPEC